MISHQLYFTVLVNNALLTVPKILLADYKILVKVVLLPAHVLRCRRLVIGYRASGIEQPTMTLVVPSVPKELNDILVSCQ